MKLYFRLTFLSALLLVIMGCFNSSKAQEAQSDYKIVQSFNNSYDKIQASLDTVTTVVGAETLVNRIQKLKKEYADHKQLLNKALYPRNFDSQVQKLANQAKSTQKRLQVIAKQRKKLEQLTGNVNQFENQLKQLRNRSDSLQQLLSQENQRSQRLSSTVRQYRENISKRDKLILAFVDSVVASYQQLDSQTLKELSTAYQKSKKNIDSNALKLIETIARTNIEFLNSTKTLSTSDYLRMYNVQQKFREMWRLVGDEILQIYSPEEGSEAIRSELKGALDEWETKVADQTWKSINRAFEESGIDLSEFGDSKGFYNSLTSYIENNMQNGSREDYENFYNFWNNTVKARWAESMAGTDILSYEQISNIDQQLNEWNKKTAPTSYLWQILVAVAVLIIIVLGIMLARAKS